jgi:hypothetical protein
MAVGWLADYCGWLAGWLGGGRAEGREGGWALGHLTIPMEAARGRLAIVRAVGECHFARRLWP